MSNINQDKLILCNACLCCNTSLFLEPQEMIGCSGEREFLCCHDAFCCKPGGTAYGIGMVPDATKRDDREDFCNLALHCCQCGLNKPSTCCLAKSHCFCLVSSAAFPTTKDVPMFCSLFTVACYPQFGVFKTQGELKK